MSGPAWPVSIGAADMVGDDRLSRVIDALAEAFDDLAAGRTRSPSRTVVEHGSDCQLLAGTSVWERRGVGSVKVTTLTPDNPRTGLPLIHGVVVLTDLTTGRIKALLDGAELTAVRTGAVAGLATRLCAPADADEMAVIGAGTQARALVRAMCAVRPIRSIRLYSRTHPERFAESIRAAGRRVTVCDSAKAAVTDAPIVCTATSTGGSAPIVMADWIMPRAHVNIVGGTHEDAIELDPALLGKAFVLVESREAALEDAGEVRSALAGGLLSVEDLHELGRPIRTRADTSVFRSVGLAIEDTAAAAALYDAAVGTS